MRVAMGLMFYPRGGSAFAVRALIPQLAIRGWKTRLAVGSLGLPGDPTHAGTFYKNCDIVTHDYTPAATAFRAGRDPMTEPVPMHPSYEIRDRALDRDFSLVEATLAIRQESAWKDTFGRMAFKPHLVHLHHLTPLVAAALEVWPLLPLVTSLHGTELKWLESHRDDAAGSAGRAWASLMRLWSTLAHSITVVSESDAAAAARLLPVEQERIAVVGSGVDADRFQPRSIPPRERLAAWKRWLVEDPRGWDESCRPGSVRYTERDLGDFVYPSTGKLKPVLIFVGRFTSVKRLPLLLSAYARLRAHLRESTPPLVVWGGAPGEWEGSHPVTMVRSLGISGVYFVGMRGHEELPLGLACSDLLVAPAVDESFGQVYVEALACGVPVVASDSGGPASLLQPRDGQDIAWLVKPDDRDELVNAILDALARPAERAIRARAGRAVVLASHTWTSVAARVMLAYEAAVERHARVSIAPRRP